MGGEAEGEATNAAMGREALVYASAEGFEDVVRIVQGRCAMWFTP